MAKRRRRRRRLESRWIRSGHESDKEDFRQCCRDSNRLINESRRQLVSSRIGQCVNACWRWSVVRKLLHDETQSARTNDDVSFCNRFANYYMSKIDFLKAAITSQLIDIAPPPLDPVCSFHLCKCSNPSPLLRSLNFFQLFHQNF